MVIQPLTILASQAFGIDDDLPALRLYRALWTDAVACIVGVGRNTGGKPHVRRAGMARDHHDAVAWVAGRTVGEVTFVEVCRALDMDPEVTARKLLAQAKPHELGVHGWSARNRHTSHLSDRAMRRKRRLAREQQRTGGISTPTESRPSQRKPCSTAADGCTGGRNG